jgi:hypothetical protein
LVRFIEDDARDHPERYKLWARKHPSFPMMVFPAKIAYRPRFDDLDGKLDIGRDSLYAAGRQTRFDTPINSLVYEETERVLQVIQRARMLMEDPSCAQSGLQEIFGSGLSDQQRAALTKAYDMGSPSLKDKKRLRTWAYEILIPILECRYPDWSSVPALKQFLRKGQGKSKAKGKIFIALRDILRVDHLSHSNPS